ncbi:uncharacterized protein [Aristolochia californica]|uniref:uncharacterized protein n=1 Tax=Aristolochia californica TaxID=171875 RepID=UPI0035D97BF8
MGKRLHLCPGFSENTKRSLPLLLFVLLCNVFGMYYLRVPFLAKIERFAYAQEGERRPMSSLSSSSVLYAVQEEEVPLSRRETRGNLQFLPVERFNSSGQSDTVFEVRSEGKIDENVRLHPRQEYPDPSNVSSVSRIKALGKAASFLEEKQKSKAFSMRVKEFFNRSSFNNRFFLTWISSEELFGERELRAVESIFKSHPDACVLIVSNSMDTIRGKTQLAPFLSHGFCIAAISPSYRYLLKDTPAEKWFSRLKGGRINPGEVSLGQSLSNLLRLALLYKFGGIYVDTDVIVLKSFSSLRNVIGAQTVDAHTGNWSRLNNAVMIFDKKHPLLYKFIEEFALTFNGNKWGYNGPYLVSRVVSREDGLNFSVLQPAAFYPVTWSTIQSLFHGPRSEAHTRWAAGKLSQIRRESFAFHLWNRQSRTLKVEEGSVISTLMLENCVFCHSLQSAL